jgi:hypothetical protein
MSIALPMAMTSLWPASLQHIEEAGVHSGDSACTLPPYNLPVEVIIAEIRRQAELLARSAEGQGADERAVRGKGWAGLSDRSQPARFADRALSSPRPSARRLPKSPRG